MGGSLGWRGVGGAGISFDSVALYYFHIDFHGLVFEKQKMMVGGVDWDGHLRTVCNACI